MTITRRIGAWIATAIVILLLTAGFARGQCTEDGWALGLVEGSRTKPDTTWVMAYASLNTWRIREAYFLVGGDSLKMNVSLGGNMGRASERAMLRIQRKEQRDGYEPYWAQIEEHELTQYLLMCAYFGEPMDSGRRWAFMNLRRYENRGSRYIMNYPEGVNR